MEFCHSYLSTSYQDVEKFLRRVQLKAFFHDKEDDSDTSNKDILENLVLRLNLSL